MFPSVFAKFLCLVSSDFFTRSYGYSGSMFDIHKNCTLVNSVDICNNNSSIIGMYRVIFLQLSFIFLETVSVFLDMSILTIHTAGDKKQSSSIFFFPPSVRIGLVC